MSALYVLRLGALIFDHHRWQRAADNLINSTENHTGLWRCPAQRRGLSFTELDSPASLPPTRNMKTYCNYDSSSLSVQTQSSHLQITALFERVFLCFIVITFIIISGFTESIRAIRLKTCVFVMSCSLSCVDVPETLQIYQSVLKHFFCLGAKPSMVQKTVCTVTQCRDAISSWGRGTRGSSSDPMVTETPAS